MTLKEFLLSKPDSFEFDLSYIFECWCDECGKYFEEEDEEYSCVQNIGEFRKDVDSKDRDSHYYGYSWIYDDIETEECRIDQTGQKISIVYSTYTAGSRDICDECKKKFPWLA